MSNTSGIGSYGSKWQKLSKRLRLILPCVLCGETDFLKKEVHHIDCNKRNNHPENLTVLCIKCHQKVHKEKLTPESNVKQIRRKKTFILPEDSSKNSEDWITHESKIEIISNLDRKTALAFRKKHLKGFLEIGYCHIYIGITVDNVLFGVIGLQNPDFGNHDFSMKADTTVSEYTKATDLLLFILRTKQIKTILEERTNREARTAYSKCFTPYSDISRYRKHGTLIRRDKTKQGYEIAYEFKLGEFASIKQAKSLFIQKHKL